MAAITCICKNCNRPPFNGVPGNACGNTCRYGRCSHGGSGRQMIVLCKCPGCNRPAYNGVPGNACGNRCRYGRCSHGGSGSRMIPRQSRHVASRTIPGQSGHVVPIMLGNFNGKRGWVLLVIMENRGYLNWVGGKTDPCDQGQSIKTAEREASEEYGRCLADVVRSQRLSDQNALMFRGSHMFLVPLRQGWSTRNGATRFAPTQTPSETSGATWLWVEDVLDADRNRPHNGEKVVHIYDVYGKSHNVSTFVLGVTKEMRAGGMF
jgi:hypothetical protein